MPRDIDEGPSEADLARFGSETRECPECGAEVYDEASVCPRCGHVFEGDEGGKMPTWAIVGAVIALIAFFVVFGLL